MNFFMGMLSERLASTINLVANTLLWVTNQLKSVKVRYTAVDLHELVNEHFDVFKSIAINKNIELINQGSHMIVNTDKHILSFALRNLIANAIKFCYTNGFVKISYEYHPSEYRLTVSDNEKGMDQETADSLFHVKSAVSTDGTNNEKGTGLGLFLCYSHLNYIQGEISVISVTGKRATFTIRVPY
jgi:signal transduction histidine kinase